MNDKSMSIILMAMFGISGIAMLMLAWLQPMLVAERITATIIGSVGLLVAFIRALLFKLPRSGAEIQRIPVEIMQEKRP